ncbi:Translin [Phaeosphaeriaceae sp. PMI808]|nr:Translin [Phaeosphaeriaceae sp. PMI808]
MAEAKPEQPVSPVVAMFEGFRKELDEHHERREKTIKASRDITAASKKIIFTLQRVRKVGETVPPFVTKNNVQYWEIIKNQYKSIAADLQGLNAHRYAHNITGGNQEFMEALSFHHYLETQSIITFEEAQAKITAMCGEGGAVSLTPEDYILGICDMTGELMRFSVTSMAASGKLPVGSKASSNKRIKQDAGVEDVGDKMDVDDQGSGPQDAEKPRSVLDDLRAIRLQLEMFEAPGGSKFDTELNTKKMPVMRECVDKVEKALYGLTVRGSERPKGWMPDMGGDKRSEVESC